MSIRLVSLALLLSLLPSTSFAANLDRDWTQVYNAPGTESALAVWPAPGGGIDIVADRNGEMVYLRYDPAGILTAVRSTGFGVGTTYPWSRVIAQDGSGGFVFAASQDTALSSGMVQLRVGANGQVLWRNPLISSIYYPAAMKVANNRVYLGVDQDYWTVFDPSLFVSNLATGMRICERVDHAGHEQRIVDMAIQDDGDVILAGYGHCGAFDHPAPGDTEFSECFSWIWEHEPDCSLGRTSYFPAHHTDGRYESLDSAFDVWLGSTNGPIIPLANASFAMTWFSSQWGERIPTQHVDSRDLLIGGCRAIALEKSLDMLVITGDHDAGSGEQELILGTSADAGSLDLEMLRPHPEMSYAAKQVVPRDDHLLLLGVQSDPGNGGSARLVALCSQDRSLLDFDVDPNIVDPVGMALGVDGGIYTVGIGPAPLPGIVITKLVVLATGVPEAATPRVSRLGLPSPNPAGSSVHLEYQVGNESQTTIEIYDAAGRLVTRLVDEMSQPGTYSVHWNTRDVARGVYQARFRSGSSYSTRKIVVVE